MSTVVRGRASDRLRDAVAIPVILHGSPRRRYAVQVVSNHRRRSSRQSLACCYLGHRSRSRGGRWHRYVNCRWDAGESRRLRLAIAHGVEAYVTGAVLGDRVPVEADRLIRQAIDAS